MPGQGRIITEIRKQDKYPKKVSVYLDGEFWKNLNLEVTVSLGLQKGQEINTDEIEMITRSEENKRALNYSLKLLGVRSRSEKEIEERLGKYGYAGDIIKETIYQLKEQGYLDEIAFAKAWIHDRFTLKNLGKNRVRQELITKGISKEIIDRELSAFSEDDERERAISLARKRCIRNKEVNARKQSRRIYQYLINKGFSGSMSSEVARKVWSENNEIYE